MRVRKKAWARPELETDGKFIAAPADYRGKWSDVFKNQNAIHVELGCGRGRFIAELAGRNPDINYIAIDTHDELLVYVLRKINANALNNVRIIAMDIEFITDVLAEDEVQKIYINFCNPWPKSRHQKRRLTHPKFLQKYQTFLQSGSEVWFKTDDDALFTDSLGYFEAAGFEELYRTYDLAAGDFKDNIRTEYEEKFIKQALTIKFARFKKG